MLALKKNRDIFVGHPVYGCLWNLLYILKLFISCGKFHTLSIFQPTFSVGDKLLYFIIVESFYFIEFYTQKLSYMARLSSVGPFPLKLWASLEQNSEIYLRLLYKAIFFCPDKD